MMEVFKALKELNVMWIIIAPYVVRCKSSAPMAAREGGILHTNDPTISHNDPTALAEEIKFQVQVIHVYNSKAPIYYQIYKIL